MKLVKPFIFAVLVGVAANYAYEKIGYKIVGNF